MADVTVVPALVRPVGQGIDFKAIAGEAMTPGQPVYVSATGTLPTVSLADGSAVSTSFCRGVVIAVAGGSVLAAAGDGVTIRALGRVTGYSTNMAINVAFYVDNDAGVIATSAGTASTVIGWGHSATDLWVQPQVVTLT